MAIYTVRTWSNGETSPETGSPIEFEVATEFVASRAGEVTEHTPEEVQLMMLEALNINLASIAQSMERLAHIQGFAHFQN